MSYPDGETNSVVSTTINQMMILPLHQSQKRKNQKILKNKKKISCFRCKKGGHYSYECGEYLSKTPGGKKGTLLLISEEESSDEESLHKDQYDSDGVNT